MKLRIVLNPDPKTSHVLGPKNGLCFELLRHIVFVSAVRMLPPRHRLFTSIPAVRMLPPWSCLFSAFQQLQCFPLEIAFYQHFSSLNASPLKLFFTSILAIGTLSPANCAFPAFQQFECFPLEVFFCLTSISAVMHVLHSNCWNACVKKQLQGGSILIAETLVKSNVKGKAF